MVEEFIEAKAEDVLKMGTGELLTEAHMPHRTRVALAGRLNRGLGLRSDLRGIDSVELEKFSFYPSRIIGWSNK